MTRLTGVNTSSSETNGPLSHLWLRDSKSNHHQELGGGGVGGLQEPARAKPLIRLHNVKFTTSKLKEEEEEPRKNHLHFFAKRLLSLLYLHECETGDV